MPMIRPRKWSPRGLISELLPALFRRPRSATEQALADPRTVKVPINAQEHKYYLHRKLEKFNANLRSSYNNNTPMPVGGLPRRFAWSVATGEWVPVLLLTAVHIFPPALTSGVERATLRRRGLIWGLPNGLLLPRTAQPAFDDWALIIVPREPSASKPRPGGHPAFPEYAFHVLDSAHQALSKEIYPRLAWRQTIGPARSELGRGVVRDLHTRPLVFGNGVRPGDRQLYFHGCCAVWKQTYLASPDCDDPADFWARFLENICRYWPQGYVKWSPATEVFNPQRAEVQETLLRQRKQPPAA